jgi:hypothetical protein
MKCHIGAWVVVVVVLINNLVNGDSQIKVRETKSLFRATSSMFPSTQSAWYTPGIHALPLIILKGALFGVATLLLDIYCTNVWYNLHTYSKSHHESLRTPCLYWDRQGPTEPPHFPCPKKAAPGQECMIQ